MYRRMLVPLDGTRRSAAVVAHAIHAAKIMRCDVALVRFVSAKDRTQAKQETAEAEEYLDFVSRRFSRAGINVWTEVRVGDAAIEILKAARTLDIEIIAMATRGRRGLKRLMFGSVADHVLTESEIPLLLITAR